MPDEQPAKHPEAPPPASGADAAATQDDKPARPRSPRPKRANKASRIPRLRKGPPGAPAGISPQQLAQMPSTPQSSALTCIDYGPDRVQVHRVEDIEDFILHHRPEWAAVRWVNVDGLGDLAVIKALAEKYELHPLAIEDLLHVGQRPKVEPYGGNAPGDLRPRLFLIARMVELREGHLYGEQISMFVGHKTLLTFQEAPGDVWDPIRTRIHKPGSQIRQHGADFLTYALLDAIVDQCFPILERYGDRLEDLEAEVLTHPRPEVVHEVHRLRRELLLLRREVWPMREVVHTLQREPHECMSETTRTYLRDVYDHTVQIIELLETYREMGTGLTEAYMSAQGMRMNEVMKVLTIIATIFIPMTFLAGVYGMNMRIPENHWRWSYPMFWAVCVAQAATMLVWFKRKGWL